MIAKPGRTTRRESGLVLVVVVFFIALLITSVATFLRRATVDASIVRNRDAVARAEALARGGVRIAEALLIEDRRLEQELDQPRADSLRDVWAQAESLQIALPEDAALRVRIEDSGARLNLNALFSEGKPQDDQLTELFLVELLRKVIEEMPVRPEEKNFDPVELARNLIDWVDEDDVRVRGGSENDYYERQRPPYKPSNLPLLSIDELRLVEGFNGLLVDALRPYTGVFPLSPATGETKGAGVNPNTAPPWVLALLFYGTAVGDDYRLSGEDQVRYLLKDREEALICPAQGEGCLSLKDAIREEGQFFPAPTFSTEIFRVTSEARVGDVERRIEAVLDRGLPSEPLRLAWRAQ